MNQYLWIPFAVTAFDQMTKRLAMHYATNKVHMIYGCFENKLLWNKGISFGLFATSYYNVLVYCAIFISLALVIITFIKSKNRLDTIAWGLIVGGGISNLWDRWFFGAVLDFIAISVQEYTFPVFNIADVAITIGAIILGRKFFSKGNSKKKSKISTDEGKKK